MIVVYDGFNNLGYVLVLGLVLILVVRFNCCLICCLILLVCGWNFVAVFIIDVVANLDVAVFIDAIAA